MLKAISNTYTVANRELRILFQDEYCNHYELFVVLDNNASKIQLIAEKYELSCNNANITNYDNIIAKLDSFINSKNDGTATNLLINRNLQIATMESCTSGLIASNITDYEGASAILKGSNITYSNQTKIQAGVDEAIIEKHGVYSTETARDMARAAKKNFNADIGIGVTGSISNIDTNNFDSVVGTIHFCIDYLNIHEFKLIIKERNISRKSSKQMVADIILSVLIAIIKNNKF